MKCALRAIAMMAVILFAAPAFAEDAMTTRVLLKTGITNIGQEIVYPSQGKPEITTMIIEIAPGGSTPLHQHPVPLVGYILQGQLEVRAEGGTVNRYQPGDAFVEALNHAHQGFNVGPDPVRILATVIGIAGEGYSVPAKR